MAHLNLQNPDMKYRPVPFWSWNDKLDTEELRHQVREMHKAGLGGFFMHARGGLQTAYLSDEWMECVSACCDEAGKLGMGAWLYDENGWPSGFGGGLVNGLGEYYQQKYLRFEVVDADVARKAEHTIAFYSADGAKLLGKTLPDGISGKVLRAYYLVNRYYVDNLDPVIVAEFIRVTHQHYYETLPKELLAHLKGIFTDEPQLSRNGLLWSLVLEKEYEREYGRELLPELAALGVEVPGCEAVRVRFWRLCAKLFKNNFMKQIRDWCDAHGWLLTGHHVLEETCYWQLSCNGSIMPQYQYYSIPGVDHLGRTVPSSVMMTQLVSVGAQFGHKQLLTESFALTGWNCNFSGQRFVFQPELAHGINLLCQHLAGYTLRGLRKRDYPASVNYHQPWWGDFHVINDYFSRVGQILAEGTAKVSTLVIHPLSSVWMQYAGVKNDELFSYYSDKLKELTMALDARQIPHHYCDELIYEENGHCENGRITIGECCYTNVVIPPVINMSARIHEMLRVFQLNGGTVFRMVNTHQPDRPFCIDGAPADADTQSWFDSLPAFADENAVADAVAKLYPERIRMTENGVPSTEMLSIWRDVDDLDGRGGRVFFICNRRYHEGGVVHVSLPKTGAQLEVIDERTGAFRLLDGVTTADGRFEFDYYFGGADSVLLFVPNSPLALKAASSCRMLMTSPAVKAVSTNMTLASSDENILTLDRCRYRVDGGEWQTCEIISLQSRLVVLKRDCKVELEIPFTVADDFDLETPLTLVVETPKLFSFALNGVPFEGTDTGYQFDSAFRRVPLPKELKHGENVISLALTYHQDQKLYDKLEAARKFETEYNTLTFETELESVYVMGDFSVRHTGGVESLEREAKRFNGSFAIAPSAVGTVVDGSDLLSAGLPFFAGSAVLEEHVELTSDELKLIRALRFDPRGANSWKVEINGKSAGDCFWEPYIVPVKDMLREGDNVIRFTWTTSLRNMLGPHHLKDGESYAIGTLSFNIEPNFVGYPAPETVPGYCFVEHGLKSVELC